MKALPRYQFRETHIGCAEHADPECLCDVIVAEPAPILVGAKHKYHDEVMRELDDHNVSSRNLYEFAQILLGMQKLEHALCFAYDSESRLQPSSPWLLLDKQTRQAMQMHCKADTPWAVAQLELEGLGLSAEDTRQVRKAYGLSASTQRDRDRKRGDAPPPAMLRDVNNESEWMRRKRRQRTGEAAPARPKSAVAKPQTNSWTNHDLFFIPEPYPT